MSEDVGRVPLAPGSREPDQQAVPALPGFDPSRDVALMRMDITHLIYAIDHGYFGDVFGLADSAFVSCLRKYALPGFEPVRPRPPQSPPGTPERPHHDPSSCIAVRG